MARDLIRNSVIEDAIAQRIALVIEHIYDAHIKPLQERVEVLERERALDEIAAIEEDASKKQVHWANDYKWLTEPTWWRARSQADNYADEDRVAVIRREWVEGQLPQYFTEGV
jgi:hypothetical protein